MTVAKKTEFAKIDKSRRFAGIYEGKTSKSYVYNVSHDPLKVIILLL